MHLNWQQFSRLETVKRVTDFHCVTGWTRLDLHWEGVHIKDLLDAVQLKKSARFITFKSADGYTTSLPISECTGEDDLLAFKLDGQFLDNSKGGPVRVVIPAKYGYKSALWITEIVATKRQETGLWEKQGYHNNADPWKEERFNFK
jgi:DMSO/TMAO reductase YedYZ molybdopterin-dependent catalytic subunit